MPASRLNLGKSLSPQEKAISSFSDEFLRSLGNKFSFDGANPEIAGAIRDIAIGYFVVLRWPDTTNYLKQTRREYIQLAKNTRKFLKILENAKESGIDSDMEYIGQINTLIDKSSSPDRNNNNAQTRSISGGYDELIRLLNLLVSTAEYGAQNYSAKPGPKIDQALEILVRRAANFWIYELGWKFTIDQHKGSGTTKSFEFIRVLASQLNNRISDTEIVTAMRTEKATRRKIELSSKNLIRRAK